MTGGGFGHETADAAADVAAAARARSAARTASSAATDSRPETSPQPAQISEPTEPSPLEARYRRLLRILPRAYRRVREEEMVTTFLAAERAGEPGNWDLAQKFDGPDWAEKRSVVALALRLRWGRSVAPARYEARLDAVRIALLAGLAITWIVATSLLISALLVLVVPPRDPSFDVREILFGLAPGSWPWVERWMYVLWIPVLPLAVLGGRRGARWAAAYAALPVGLAVFHAVTWPAVGPVTTLALLIDLGLLAGLAVIGWGPPLRHDADREARPYGFLVAAGAAVVLLAGFMLLIMVAPDLLRWFAITPVAYVISFDPGWWCVAAVAVAVFALHARGRPVSVGTVTGVALVAGVSAVYAGVWALAYGPAAWVRRPFDGLEAVTIALELGASAAIFVIAGILAVQRFRRLPTARYAAAEPGRG